MPFRSHRAPLAALLVASVIAACGGPTDAGGSRIALVPRDASVTPFEVAEVVVRGQALGAENYTGTLSSAAITAGRTSDSTLAFVVPGLAAGQHTLSIEIAGEVTEATFTVAAGAPLADPAAYTSDIHTAYEAQLGSLEGELADGRTYGTDPALVAADIALARDAFAAARAEFLAMTPDEQREAASILRASARLDPDLDEPGANMTLAAASDLCGDPNIPLTVEEAEECANLSTSRLTGVMARLRDLFDQEPYACQTAAEEAARRGLRIRIRTFLIHTVNGCHYARLSKWAHESWEATAFPTTPKFFWEEDLLASGVSASVTAVPKQRFTFGAPTAFTPPITFRAMIASDIGRVPAATTRAALLRDLEDAWSLLNRILPTSMRQAPATLEAVATAPARQLTYPASRLRLGAITPASVTGTAAVANGQWTVTFNAGDHAGEIPFTFKVIYDGGQYGSDTLVVPAVLGDSVPVYEAAAVGWWTMYRRAPFGDHWDITSVYLSAELENDWSGRRKAVFREPALTTGHPCPWVGWDLVGANCEMETLWQVRAANGRYLLYLGYDTPETPLTMPITEYLASDYRYVKD